MIDQKTALNPMFKLILNSALSRLWAASMLCWVMWSESFAAPVLTIDISNPAFRKLIIAVPEFQTEASLNAALEGKLETPNGELKDQAKEDRSEDGLASLVAEELPRLLEFSSVFSVIKPAAFKDILAQNKDIKTLYTQKSIEVMRLNEWKAIGVEVVVLGYIEKAEDGQRSLSLRVVDVPSGRLMLSRRFRNILPKDHLSLVRSVGDRIVEAYTRASGIFHSRLVFVGKKTRKSEKHIFMADFDGKNLTQLTTGTGPNLSPSWSPDGSSIVYTSYEAGDPELYMIEVATGKRRRVTFHKGLDSGGSFAPDGDMLAYSSSTAGDSNIYVSDLNGKGRKLLIRGVGLDVAPVISPDGKWMAFVSGRYVNPHIFRARLSWSSSRSLRVTSDKRLTYAGWYNATPAWSPDSKRIAFGGFDKQTNRFDIFVMDSDGGNIERLTIRSGDNENPSWSPNGLMLAFHSNRIGKQDRKGPAQIYLMKSDGTFQKKVNVPLYEAQTPKWSANVFGLPRNSQEEQPAPDRSEKKPSQEQPSSPSES